MKFRKCAAAGVLALCLAAAGPLSALAGQNAGPGAAYQPSVNGVNIYVSKMGNTLTLKQYAQTIGTWPVKLGRRSETGDKAVSYTHLFPCAGLPISPALESAFQASRSCALKRKAPLPAWCSRPC